jgi:hypothetical protein
MSKTSLSVEKLRSLRNTLTSGRTFKSYRELCEYFEIKPTGGRTKTAIMEEFSNHCEWEQDGNSICVIELKPYDPEQVLKIAAKDLKSELYPPCGYILLNFLIEQGNCNPDKIYHYCTKRSIMNIMFICNDNYSSNSATQSLEEISKKNDESRAFCREVKTNLDKKVYEIIRWLKKMELLTYSEAYMVKITGKKPREATVEETNDINDYYDFVKYEYGFNKYGLMHCSNAQEIKDKFEEQQKKKIYKHYTVIKFHLTDELVSNANKLKRSAKLNDNCGYEVNSLMCAKLYETVLKFIHKNIFSMSFEEFFEDFVLNGAPIKDKFGELIKYKFNEQWRFSSDDDFIKQTIEELVNKLIKIDYCYES